MRLLRLDNRNIASIERLWETSWDLWLGRNAAVYPSHTLPVKGEIIQQDIRPSSLQEVALEKKNVDSARRVCMLRWLSGGRWIWISYWAENG
jgi:hypothetical protein